MKKIVLIIFGILLVTNQIPVQETGTITDAAGVFTPDDSLSITVTYTPTAVQIYLDSLTILSDDPDEPGVKVTLTGTGIVSEIALSNLTPQFCGFFDL
jgi:hypothetical protein